MNLLTHEQFVIRRPVTIVSAIPARPAALRRSRHTKNVAAKQHSPSALHKGVRHIVVTVIALALFFVV